MAGDSFYALVIFYFMMVLHVVFLVSVADNVLVIVLTWGDADRKNH
jgi:hypothetical protein